ncbi:MAG: lytic murein transglycosylase [Nitrospiria bacterium]
MENRRIFIKQFIPRIVGIGGFLSMSVPSLNLLAATVSERSSEPSNRIPLNHPKYQALLKELAKKYTFEPKDLETLFKRVVFQGEIIHKFNRPSESLPFYKYRKIFLKKNMFEGGHKFINKNKVLLKKIEAAYGVEHEVISSILGVETRFGKPGIEKYRAFDILNTAYFLYPRREAFYRAEIIAFLRLCREENLDPFSIKSSYAGAFGVPQFIPSSFLRYSVDFDGDGKRDLWQSKGDIFASVANYLKTFGWKPGQLTYLPARIMRDSAEVQSALKRGFRKTMPVVKAMEMGIEIPPPAKGNDLVSFAFYEPKPGEQALLALFENFRALTRYNVSVNYALTIVHLSRTFSMSVTG